MIAVVCALASAAMFYLSQGTDDVWALAWFAPAPLLWLAYGQSRGWQVFAAAMAAFAAGQIYLAQCYGMALIATVVAFMLGGGVLFGGVVLLARQIRRAMPVAAILGFPAAWTATEYVIGLFSPHGSFGALGYSQMSFPAALQVAPLLGLYAVTFLVCLFANALALLARGQREAGAVGVAVAALAVVYGAFQLAAPTTSGIRVAALADEGRDYLRSFRGDADAALSVTREYAGAIRALAAKGTHVFVTPEGGVITAPPVRDRILAPLIEAARDTHSLIVVGSLSQRPDRNMALAIDADGHVTTYDKRRPLMPLESRFTPGHGRGLLGRGRAMVICKDMDFPRMIRGDVLAAGPAGLRLMLVPSGDFMRDDWLHGRMAIMRGVENGFAMVRPAFNGLELISDAQGRVIAKARVDHPGLVVAEGTVEPGNGPTLYTAIGDVFAWACVGLTLLLSCLAFRKGRAAG